MDRIVKIVFNKVKEKSLLQRELFWNCYKHKLAYYNEDYSNLLMNM